MATATREVLPAPYTLDGYRSDVDIDWSTVDNDPGARVIRGVAALRSRGWYTREHVNRAIDAVSLDGPLAPLPHYRVATWLGNRFGADSEEWLEAHGFLEVWALSPNRRRIPGDRHALDQWWHNAFAGLPDA